MFGVPDTGGVRRLGVGVLASLCGRLRANARCWGESIGAGARRCFDICCMARLLVTSYAVKSHTVSKPYQGRPIRPGGRQIACHHYMRWIHRKARRELSNNGLLETKPTKSIQNKVRIEIG